jgi:hypothetical protein
VNDDLTNWVERTCPAVAAKRWQSTAGTGTSAQRGFGATGGLQLYDCAGKAR